MQTTRQRPSLTINPNTSATGHHQPASPGQSNLANVNLPPPQPPSLLRNNSIASVTSINEGNVANVKGNGRNPYQTPQASTSNFNLSSYYNPQNPINATAPMTPNYIPTRPGLHKTALNDSKVSILSDDDDFGNYDNNDNDDDYDDRMSLSLYSNSSLNNSSILDCTEYPNQLNQRQIVFTKVFETLLINTYHAYLTNPQLTPFSGRYPPSGIVLKVSKEALKKALNQNVQIDLNVKNNTKYKTLATAKSNSDDNGKKNNNPTVIQAALLSQIRQKLIELSSKNFYNNNGGSYGNNKNSSSGLNLNEIRNSSVSSLNSFNNYTNNASTNGNAANVISGPNIDDGFSNLSITTNNGTANTIDATTTTNNHNLLFLNNQQSSSSSSSPQSSELSQLSQLSPINHTFSPINANFNNFYIPEISSSAATPSIYQHSNNPNNLNPNNLNPHQNATSIHDALNNYINKNHPSFAPAVGTGQRSINGSIGNSSPLTPITPITPFPNTINTANINNNNSIMTNMNLNSNMNLSMNHNTILNKPNKLMSPTLENFNDNSDDSQNNPTLSMPSSMNTKKSNNINNPTSKSLNKPFLLSSPFTKDTFNSHTKNNNNNSTTTKPSMKNLKQFQQSTKNRLTLNLKKPTKLKNSTISTTATTNLSPSPLQNVQNDDDLDFKNDDDYVIVGLNLKPKLNLVNSDSNSSIKTLDYSNGNASTNGNASDISNESEHESESENKNGNSNADDSLGTITIDTINTANDSFGTANMINTTGITNSGVSLNGTGNSDNGGSSHAGEREVNVSSRRKRNSFKMKRFGNCDLGAGGAAK